MLSCTGNPYVKTPAVDRLAARACVSNGPIRESRLLSLPLQHDDRRAAQPHRHGPTTTGRAATRKSSTTPWGTSSARPATRRCTAARSICPRPTCRCTPTASGTPATSGRAWPRLRRLPPQRHDGRSCWWPPSSTRTTSATWRSTPGRGRRASRWKCSPGIRERQCLAEALRLPAGVSREEFFRKACPPLPKNFAIPRDEPPAVRETDWRPFRQYVQDHWTAEDWRLHRWAYARLVERADAEIGTRARRAPPERPGRQHGRGLHQRPWRNGRLAQAGTQVDALRRGPAHAVDRQPQGRDAGGPRRHDASGFHRPGPDPHALRLGGHGRAPRR